MNLNQSCLPQEEFGKCQTPSEKRTQIWKDSNFELFQHSSAAIVVTIFLLIQSSLVKHKLIVMMARFCGNSRQRDEDFTLTKKQFDPQHWVLLFWAH